MPNHTIKARAENTSTEGLYDEQNDYASNSPFLPAEAKKFPSGCHEKVTRPSSCRSDPTLKRRRISAHLLYSLMPNFYVQFNDQPKLSLQLQKLNKGVTQEQKTVLCSSQASNARTTREILKYRAERDSPLHRLFRYGITIILKRFLSILKTPISSTFRVGSCPPQKSTPLRLYFRFVFRFFSDCLSIYRTTNIKTNTDEVSRRGRSADLGSLIASEISEYQL